MSRSPGGTQQLPQDVVRLPGEKSLASAANLSTATLKSSAPPRRYLSLDHWRGIACLIVVITHATAPMCHEGSLTPAAPITAPSLSPHDSSHRVEQSLPKKIAAKVVWLTTKMHFGVEMFFVISGYCITASAESLRRSGATMRDYFRRRFVRIYPPYWSILALSVVFCFASDALLPGLLGQGPWVVAMPWDLSVWQWLGSLTLTGTWIGYLSGESSLCFPHQSWTLCFEEQFYAVIGLVFVCSGRWFFRSLAMITAIIAAIDISAIYFQFPVRGFFFDEHWAMFAAGIAVYWVLNCASRRAAITFNVLLALTILGLGTATFLFGSGTQFNAWRLVGSLCFAGLLILLKPFDERISAAKSLGWLRSCGVMCYSIYLVHLFPGKLISQFLVASGYVDDLSILCICLPTVIATSVSLGYLFHVSIEKQFLSAAVRPSQPVSPSAGHVESPQSLESPQSIPFVTRSAASSLNPAESRKAA